MKERMMPDPLESAESASPLITRLVAGSLVREQIDGLSLTALERLGLRLLEQLPVRFAQAAAAWRVARGALPQGSARVLKSEELVQARLADYGKLSGQFDIILCGSALGGASAHLAAILGGPFLPQPFILGLQGGSRDDRLKAYLERVKPIAQDILRNNPGIRAIAHYDPVHDGWLTRSMSHLRLKLIGLPAGYREFIQRRLKPGGTILYLDCSANWLQFQLGDRLELQVGGWGGIPPEEFINGSERVDRFLAESGSIHRGGWKPAGLEPEWKPESEWGSVPGLDRELEEFAAAGGFEYKHLRFDHPHKFSRLAFEAHHELYSRAGVEPRGVLIEMFTQYAPWITIERGLLPVWLIFNTRDSLDFLRAIRSHFPEGIPAYLSALVTLSRTPDMVAWDDWAAALNDMTWFSIGARREKYPEDLLALGSWVTRLARLTTPIEHIPEPLPLDVLLQLATPLQRKP
jgi:hypothetical protein